MANEIDQSKQAANGNGVPRVIRLGPGECPDSETGARFFAALAFPGAGEECARLEAVQGWTGAYLHEANRVDESDEPFEDQRLNAFLDLPPAWCKAKVRTARRRLRDRSDAARAVRPWVRELLADPHPPVPGIRKFSQRQIALYLFDGDTERAANFQHRVWRPSRPVIHIAIAYDLVLSALDGQRDEFGLDLGSTAFVGELVARAKLLEPKIIGDHRFGISQSEMIQLEWVP